MFPIYWSPTPFAISLITVPTPSCYPRTFLHTQYKLVRGRAKEFVIASAVYHFLTGDWEHKQEVLQNYENFREERYLIAEGKINPWDAKCPFNECEAPETPDFTKTDR